MRSLLVLIACSSIIGTYAQDQQIYRMLREKSEEYHAEAVRVRRELHRIPEVCYCEEKTSQYVAEYLASCGLEVATNIGGMRGIKAVLRGTQETPVVGIRADMDALPITEATDLEWTSEHEGFMHACGHDIHMTNGLMAAKMLTDSKDQIPGSVVFIFQPCEEGSGDERPGGASMLIEAGILENPKIDALFGLHVVPGFPIGSVALREGPIMANVATIRIAILGKSSHGAFPHQGIDAVYAASMAVVEFQSIISRVRNPNDPAVLSIGKINGGVRMNVIADRVEMEGTVRSFSRETELMIEERIEKILRGLSVAYGIDYEYQFLGGSKYVKNDSRLTAMAESIFKELLGEENVIQTDPMTIAEDFSQYSHIIPSFFYFLGAGEGTLHHPQFAPDDEILKYGPLTLSAAAMKFLFDN